MSEAVSRPLRVVLLRSRAERDGSVAHRPLDPYTVPFDTRYADRVLANLLSPEAYCTACGPDCIHCRRRYPEIPRSMIAAILEFPSRLPYILENPRHYLPLRVPLHEVLLAIHVHEQIFLEILKVCRGWGTRGVVVPREAPHWISGAAMAEARRIAQAEGLEIDFPKPFCAFDPPTGGILSEFRRTFRIGKPEVRLSLDGGRIVGAEVAVSAPCGATYCVARHMIGRSLEEDLRHDVIARYWHSFPCTASMEWDAELGDTVLHRAGQMHYGILDSMTRPPRAPEPAPLLLVAPGLGKTITAFRPVPVQENLRQLEQARKAILDALAAGVAMTLRDLRALSGMSPAMLHAALLSLRREGRLTASGPHTWRLRPPSESG